MLLYQVFRNQTENLGEIIKLYFNMSRTGLGFPVCLLKKYFRESFLFLKETATFREKEDKRLSGYS